MDSDNVSFSPGPSSPILPQDSTSNVSLSTSQASSSQALQASFFTSLYASAQDSALTISPIKARARRAKHREHTPFPFDAVVKNRSGKTCWQCKYCKVVYLDKGGTTHIYDHLLERHNINLKNEREVHQERTQQTIQESYANVDAQKPDHKRRRLIHSNVPEALDPDILEDLYVKWISACGVSMNMCARPEFRA